MSGRPALEADAAPRVLVVDGEAAHELFVVVGLAGGVLRARAAYLFERGEELRLRIEHGGTVREAVARVRGHTGPDGARITELELAEPHGRT